MLWYRTLLSVIDITWNLEQHYKLETRATGYLPLLSVTASVFNVSPGYPEILVCLKPGSLAFSNKQGSLALDVVVKVPSLFAIMQGFFVVIFVSKLLVSVIEMHSFIVVFTVERNDLIFTVEVNINAIAFAVVCFIDIVSDRFSGFRIAVGSTRGIVHRIVHKASLREQNWWHFEIEPAPVESAKRTIHPQPMEIMPFTLVRVIDLRIRGVARAHQPLSLAIFLAADESGCRVVFRGVDVEERINKSEKRIAIVIADGEVQSKFYVSVDVSDLSENIFHALCVIGVAVDLKIEPDISKGCFVDLSIGLESYSRAEM